MADSLPFRFVVLQEQAPPAPGPDSGKGASPAGPSLFASIFPFIIIFVLFYFILIRPQRRQQKERERMIATLKKNDRVLTSGGIYGIVDRIKEHELTLKVDEKSDVRLRVARSAIVGLEKTAGGSEEPKSSETSAEQTQK
ncbi:MAG: preprotein translocase subunit YajC [Planctomycetes bacterium]|nr:preprotein translocase subunit YajC [Planctomycetota bacterium]